MSCNCDVQISDLSNRITGLESDIGNIYTSGTSSLLLSNAIIQQYANISNVAVSGLYLGNLTIGNVTSLTGNLRVSNVISSSANSLFWADGAGEKLYLQATGPVAGGEGNTIVFMGGNANVVGNVSVGGGGGGERVARAYQWRVRNDVTETVNGNRSLLPMGRPQIEYVFTNPWSLRTIGVNQWNSVCWSPKLGLFCAVASSGVANRVATSPDGITWIPRSTSGLDESWNSVCWSPELGIFCAVASSGVTRIMTSFDGATWTGQTTPEANAWNSVCWSPDLYLFCAVASSGTNRVMISSNGTSWVAYPASSALSWTSVVWSYENRILLAVASDSGTVMYSGNGTSWVSSMGVGVGATSVCWSSYRGLFCVVGTGSGGNYIATSPDGVVWTARTPATIGNWRSVIWVPEMKSFLATNSDATGNSIMYSFDGITWATDTASYPGVMYGYGLTWSPELGVVIEIGTSSIRTSPSIYTLNAFTFSLLTTSNNFVVNQNGIFVNATAKYVGIGNTNPQNDLDIYGNIIAGRGPGNYSTSTTIYTFNNFRPFGWDSDGAGNLNVSQSASKNFLIRGGPSDSTLVACAVNGSTNSSFNNNGYLNASRDYILRNANLTISQGLSVGGNVVTVDYVTNKVGFNLGNLSLTSNLFGVGGSANIAGNLNVGTGYANVFTGTVSYSRGRHISSKTTTQIPAYGVPQRDYTISRFRGGTYPVVTSTTGWNTLIWSPQKSIFVSLSGNGNNTRAMTSPDGITWTSQTLGNQAWTDIGWSPELGLFIGIPNNSSSIVTSPDGVVWTTVNTGTGVTGWASVAWAPELGIFCVVGVSTTSTRVMTSPDGNTWTLQDSVVYNQWRTLTWSPDLRLFMAAADSGSANRVMTSPDGVVWTVQTTPNGNYYGSVWSPELGLFAVVGSSTCITSPDGVVWTTRSVSGNMWFDITWSPSLRLFCAISTATSGNSIMTSPDGITWTGRTPTINMSGRAIAWSEELGIFCLVGNSLSTSVGNSVVISESMYAYHPYDYNIYGNLAVSGNILYVGATLGNVGILTTTPTANLEVNGEAAKTGGGNWSTSSDARVKEEIVKADTRRCYEIVKELDLKYYKYREDTVPYQYDRHSLGWIAQEAEVFFPKSILTANLYGISDLKLLDSDQIMKCMYGALEELLPRLDALEELVEDNEEKRIALMSRG